MATKPLPSPEVLRQLLRYEPETGKLFWRERGVEWFVDKPGRSRQHSCTLWNNRYAGSEAKSDNGKGYLRIGLMGGRYKVHRVVWAMTYGEWPKDEIDHINGIKTDNRISNIRHSDRSGNVRNVGLRSDNTSGYKGVCWCKASQKWRVTIQSGRNREYAGDFDTPEAAHAAYCAAAERLHGEFARTE